jgi:hypothetical protein
MICSFYVIKYTVVFHIGWSRWLWGVICRSAVKDGEYLATFRLEQILQVSIHFISFCSTYQKTGNCEYSYLSIRVYQGHL